jgi:hypothetical protein
MSGVAEANRTLRSKTDEEWISDIEALPEEMRKPVARVVWWDWMSGRPATERNPEFDQFITYTLDPEPISESKLIKGLLAVGYTELQATTRIRRGL